jgi:hypothetical protein
MMDVLQAACDKPRRNDGEASDRELAVACARPTLTLGPLAPLRSDHHANRAGLHFGQELVDVHRAGGNDDA